MEFFLGVFSSLVATFLIWYSQEIGIRWGLWSLEGYWIEDVHGEDVDGAANRVFVTNFSFNRLKRDYTYSGRSFTANGTPEWEWSSQALTINRNEKILYYVYKSWKLDGPSEEHYGFGLIRYETQDQLNRLQFVSGIFRGSLEKHMPQSRTLYRARKVIKQLKINKGNLRDIEYQRYVARQFRLTGDHKV